MSSHLRQLLSADARMALASNLSIAGFARIERSDGETARQRHRTALGKVQLVLRY